jgi:hypothetical protein
MNLSHKFRVAHHFGALSRKGGAPSFGKPRVRLILGASLILVTALAIWAAIPAATHKQNLAADLPPGALLTIESPDFATLLKSWNTSPEQSAWLKSANYSAFANSRLFGRLNDAAGEFAGVANAKSGFGAEFLQQVAGNESIFAWYDISKLEFLYISHLPPGKTANVELLQQRAKFSRRESGGASFYVRTSTSAPSTDANPDDNASAGPSSPRTVAFAVRGDWLILATREDLVASTLLLMQQQSATAPSQATEGWYAATEAAAPAQQGELHMLLDLQRITATDAFRTYWVQRNVTDTRQYRSAVVDLYREPNSFREERVLLPNTTDNDATPQPDLAALEALVPDRASVYRASASPDPADALASLDEKLLTRAITSTVADPDAPAADLSTPQPGSSTDLETRIDIVAPKPEPATAATASLLSALQSAGLTSMLTIDRTDPPTSESLFVPIHSAVVLRSTTPWNATQLQTALLTALRSHLTIGTLGLAWTPSGDFLTLGAAHPLTLFVDGDTAILASDPTLMTDILARRSTTTATQPATFIAAFRHTQERPNFNRLTASLTPIQTPRAVSPTAPTTSGDSSDAGPGIPPPLPPPTEPTETTPDFFANNIASLSNAFRTLATERFIQRTDGPLTHQTVVYTWQSK